MKYFVQFTGACVGFVFFLLLWAYLMSPELPESPVHYSEKEIQEHKERIDTSFDSENFQDLPVIWQKVDYSEGKKASWFPKNESPILRELVEEGQLPPVEERTGPEPVVLKGADGIGNYGGSWMRISTSPIDIQYAFHGRMTGETLVRWSPLGYPVVPHLAKRWEVSPDKKIWTFYLRKGVKWSDGHPFSADDILYWWKELQEDLDPRKPLMTIKGQFGTVKKINQTTVQFQFPISNTLFLEKLATISIANSPKHYLAPYHPTEGDQELIQKTMIEKSVDNARSLYIGRIKNFFNPDHPRLWPWIYRTEKSNPPQIFVRNPYYWAVDPEGNQLPYINRVFFDVKNPQFLSAAVASGAVSMQSRHIAHKDYTLLMSQRKEQDYELLHWYTASGSSWVIWPNFNRAVEEGNVESKQKHDLLRKKEFRQALSLAINREQIIKAEYSGQGVSQQNVPPKGSPFYHEKLANSFVEYDPQRANSFLDQIGLKKRDNEGFRTFPDGSRMTWFLEYVGTGGPVQFVVEDWKEVGIRVIQKERSRSLLEIKMQSRDIDLMLWTGDSEFHPLINPSSFVPTNANTYFAIGYGKWFRYGGFYGDEEAEMKGGIKPEEDGPIFEIMKIYDQALSALTLEEQKNIFKGVFDIASEEVWTISVSNALPALAAVKNNFKNVPKNIINGSFYRTPANGGIETFYFESSEESPGAIAHIKQEMVKHKAKATSQQVFQGGEVKEVKKSNGERLGGFIRNGIICIVVLLIILLGYRHPYIARRLFIMIPTLVVISVVTFTIIQIPPGDFIDAKISQLKEAGDEGSIEEIRRLRETFHMDDHPVLQYARWVGLYWFFTFDSKDFGLLQGNMGISMENQRSVNAIVGDRILLTVLISLGTILFTWALALPIGIYSAVRQYSIGDYFFSIVGFLGMCIPNFLLALILMYWSGKYLGIEVTGLFSPEYAAQPEWSWGKFVDLMKHIWLPIVVLGTGGMAGMIRVMRANLLDELKKPYVVTARAKGVRPFKLLLKYPVRIALNPFISSIGGIFPALVSGGAIVAIVLSIPTVGPLMLEALLNEDMYLAGSMLMVLSLLGVLGTLVSDLLLLVLDPRIRLGNQK